MFQSSTQTHYCRNSTSVGAILLKIRHPPPWHQQASTIFRQQQPSQLNINLHSNRPSSSSTLGLFLLQPIMERNRRQDTVNPRHRTGSRRREAARVSIHAHPRTSDLTSNSDPDRRSARLAEQLPIVALPPRLSRLSISRDEGLGERVACLPSVRHLRASARTAKENIRADIANIGANK